MKPIIAFILNLLVLVHFVQAEPTKEELFNLDAEKSKLLAVKLYPDSTNAESKLVKQMVAVDQVLKQNESGAFYLSSKPLLLSAFAAELLNIKPKWEALDDQEKQDAFMQLVNGYMTISDFSPKKQASAIPTPQYRLGEDLGDIQTIEGVVFKESKLTKVEPDGITVSNQSGVAKILFAKLPEEMQKRYNYDPISAEAYSKEQKQLREAAQLNAQKEAAQSDALQSRKSQTKTSPVPTSARIQPSEKGFTYFYNKLLGESGPMVGKASSSGVKRGYSKGPLQGLNEDGGLAAAKQMWAQLSLNEKISYEQAALETGAGPSVEERFKKDPRLKGTILGPNGEIYQIQ